MICCLGRPKICRHTKDHSITSFIDDLEATMLLKIEIIAENVNFFLYKCRETKTGITGLVLCNLFYSFTALVPS